MSRGPPISLSHGGFHVFDMDRMVDFFTSALGLRISDQADDKSITFMGADPRDHHQLVLYAGRATADDTVHYNHMAFRVPGLDRLREIRRRVLDFPGVVHQHTVTHGNTWSFYFFDPEGNRTEVFVDTPWQVHQPFRFELDLAKSDQTILAETEALVNAVPGTQAIDDWRDQFAAKLGIDPQ